MGCTSVFAQKSEQERVTELYQACERGDLDQVRLLLNEGVSPNAESLNYQSLPFHEAIKRGHNEIVKLFIAKGAKLNSGDPLALEVAAGGVTDGIARESEMGTQSMFELLVSLGADIHAHDEAALSAASRSRLSTVQMLVKLGSKPTHSAMAAAVFTLHLDIVDYFVNAGIDPRGTDAKGRTLLHEAAARSWGYWRINEDERNAFWNRLISLGINIDATDHQGRTALLEAAEAPNAEMLAWLIKHKANVHAVDENGMTALTLAVKAKEGPDALIVNRMASGSDDDPVHEIVKLLLKAGAKVAMRDHAQLTALDHALAAESWPSVDTLLRAGAVPVDAAASLARLVRATLDHFMSHQSVGSITRQLLPRMVDVRTATVDGLPLLSWAVLMNDKAIAQSLHKAGGDINAVDSMGRTPLIFAALIGADSMSSFLLKAGADPLLKNKSGMTANEIATHRAGVLKSAPAGLSDGSLAPPLAKADDDLFDAIATHRLTDVKRLVAANKAGVAAMRGGLQPLHLAISFGHRDIAEQLLEHGASLLAKTADGSLPITVAIESDYPELAQWLLNRAAKEAHLAMQKELLLLWGNEILFDAKGRDSALKLLIYSGWKPVDAAEATRAMSPAVWANDLATVKWLVSHGAELAPPKENDPFASIGHDQNLIKSAANSGGTSVLLFLLEKVQANRKAWSAAVGEALDSVSWEGKLPAVQVLLEYSVESNRFTALNRAVTMGHFDVAKYLLSKGVKPIERDDQSSPLLSLAVATTDIAMVKLLLDYGANLEAKDENGRTALHQAARRGLIDIARLLTDKGARRDAKDKQGLTPTQLAELGGFEMP